MSRINTTPRRTTDPDAPEQQLPDDATLGSSLDQDAMDRLDAAAEWIDAEGMVGFDPAGLDGHSMPDPGLGGIGLPEGLSPDMIGDYTDPRGTPGDPGDHGFGADPFTTEGAIDQMVKAANDMYTEDDVSVDLGAVGKEAIADFEGRDRPTDPAWVMADAETEHTITAQTCVEGSEENQDIVDEAARIQAQEADKQKPEKPREPSEQSSGGQEEGTTSETAPKPEPKPKPKPQPDPEPTNPDDPGPRGVIIHTPPADTPNPMSDVDTGFDPELDQLAKEQAARGAVGSLSDPGSDETGAATVGTDPRFDPAAFDRALEAQIDPYINPHPDDGGDDGFEDPFGNVASSAPVLDQGQSLIDPPDLDDPTGGQAPAADGADLMEV